MVEILGGNWSRRALRERVGDLAQIAGFRHVTLEDGQGRGQRVIEVDTGGGLCFDVLADRTLDLGQARFRGAPLAWIGPNGLRGPWSPGVAEHGFSPMERGIAGLLTTCGFENVRLPAGKPMRQGMLAAHDPLHGSMPFTPAEQVSAREVWEGDDCLLRIEGRVTQFLLDGPSYELRRRIEAPLGAREIRIFDRIENIGVEPTAPMALYHINFGWPLVDDGARFEWRDGAGAWSGRELPRFSAEPIRSVHIEPALAHGGRAAARIVPRPGADLPVVTVEFDPRNLPFVQSWRRTEPRINIFAIEPISHRLAGREELAASGDLEPLAPGDSIANSLTLSFA